MKRTAADGFVIDARRNAAALTRNPGVAVIVGVRGQAVLSGELSCERASHPRVGSVESVIGKQNWIQALLIVRSALIEPGRLLSIRRTRVIERHPKSREIRHVQRVSAFPVLADRRFACVQAFAGRHQTCLRIIILKSRYVATSSGCRRQAWTQANL